MKSPPAARPRCGKRASILCALCVLLSLVPAAPVLGLPVSTPAATAAARTRPRIVAMGEAGAQPSPPLTAMDAAAHERVVVLGSLDGNILRFKTLLLLAGIAEEVRDATTPAAVAAVPEPSTDALDDAEMAAELSAEVAQEAATEAGLSLTPMWTGNEDRRRRRAARVAAGRARFAHVSTARLQLRPECRNTILVLLGNSVGREPHSHEVLDLIAQLRRESVETNSNNHFQYLLGENELAFLSGRSVGAGLPGAARARDARQERRMIRAFYNSPSLLNEAFGPYGNYGRFFLNYGSVAVRHGDTVFVHAGLPLDGPAQSVHEANSAFLQGFLELYETRGVAETVAGTARTRVARATGPVRNHTVVEAAMAGECAPLQTALARLTAAEGLPVRRMVAAGPPAASTPHAVTSLCDGALLVVRGSEGPEVLAMLELRAAADDGASAAARDAARLLPTPLYPFGERIRAVFALLRQPVAQPRLELTIGEAHRSTEAPADNAAAFAPPRNALTQNLDTAAVRRRGPMTVNADADGTRGLSERLPARKSSVPQPQPLRERPLLADAALNTPNEEVAPVTVLTSAEQQQRRRRRKFRRQQRSSRAGTLSGHRGVVFWAIVLCLGVCAGMLLHARKRVRGVQTLCLSVRWSKSKE